MSRHAGTLWQAFSPKQLCVAAGAELFGCSPRDEDAGFRAPSECNVVRLQARVHRARERSGSRDAAPEISARVQDDYRVTGQQPTFAFADLDNPILQPWAREVVRKQNDLVQSGKPAFSLHASCYPVGVPSFDLLADDEADVLRPGTEESADDPDQLRRRSPCLSERAAFEGSETVLERRIGRPLRGRYAGRRHDRAERQDARWTDSRRRTPRSCTSSSGSGWSIPRRSKWRSMSRTRACSRRPGPRSGYSRREGIARRTNIANVAMLASAGEGPLLEAICSENPGSLMGLETIPIAQSKA